MFCILYRDWLFSRLPPVVPRLDTLRTSMQSRAAINHVLCNLGARRVPSEGTSNEAAVQCRSLACILDARRGKVAAHDLDESSPGDL